MGWHLRNESRGHRQQSLMRIEFFTTRKDPRLRSAKYRHYHTQRQRAVYRRRHRSCVCPLGFQIGGGQCGFCGRFSHREWAARRQ